MTPKAKMIALLRHAAQSGPLDYMALERMAGRALRLTEPVDVAKLRQRLADTEDLATARLAGLRGALTVLDELQLAWEIGQNRHQNDAPERCPDPVCDGYIGPDADLDVEHADDCRYVALRKLAGLEADDG
jgi:hypothetical protein